MSAYMMAFKCLCGDGCPQHLSGNLATSRPLPMMAGKHAVMDLTLCAHSARHNVNLFLTLHSAARSSFPLISVVFEIWIIMHLLYNVCNNWFALGFIRLDNVSQMLQLQDIKYTHIIYYIMALLCPFESLLNVETRTCIIISIITKQDTSSDI